MWDFSQSIMTFDNPLYRFDGSIPAVQHAGSVPGVSAAPSSVGGVSVASSKPAVM